MAYPNKYWLSKEVRTKEYTDSLVYQLRMWIQGVSLHNQFSDECCPDFSCCYPDMLNSDEDRVRIGNKKLLEILPAQ